MAFAAAAMTAASLPAVAGNGEPLPGLSNAHNWSPAFRQWYALAQTEDAVEAAHETWERNHRDVIGFEARREAGCPYLAFTDKLHDFEAAIYERPVRSFTDVAELGMIALFWDAKEDHDDDPPSGAPSFALGRNTNIAELSQGERAQVVLIQAAAKMAMGMGGAA